MINIFNNFKEIFARAILKIAAENNVEILPQDLKNFTVEPTREKTHGDLACNAAMILVKKFAGSEFSNPRKLAEKIISEIADKNIQKLEIAGPGFINIHLNDEIFQSVVKEIVEQNFEFPNLGKGEKVNLEYASPNPTGPIHVGHTRGAIYGDVLASLLKKCGYDVLKEYYINDAGSQIKTLLTSALFRYAQACGIVDTDRNFNSSEAYATKGEFGKMIVHLHSINSYPGDYLIEIGEKLEAKYGKKLIDEYESQAVIASASEAIHSDALENILSEIRDFVINEMVEMIKTDLRALGIIHDSYFSEKKNLHEKNKIESTIKILQDQDLVYEGKLEAPKTEKGVGALPEGYDERDQSLFRSTKFGDDCDRVVKKADGSYTYFGADLAYILSKFERGATKFIMPLGYDHAGYVKRLTAAVSALTKDKAELKIILCQMVKFVKNGAPLKMSKRAGNFITARDVIEEVGADALRFIMLTRKNDAPFDFDLEKVIEASKDNPIFYVQYAHARCSSVLRQAGEIIDVKNLQVNNLTFLQDESEIEIIKKLANFPRIIEMAAVNFEPHRIAFYLQDLAGEFHALWNKGMENPNLRFIIKDNLQLTNARLYLVLALQKIIALGLDIFNIKAKEEMR
jgi:arginyl-tRNA synthetase